MLLAINDISLMFIGLAVMVLLFASFFTALRNIRHKQIAYRMLQTQKEETERQKQMLEQTLVELKETQKQLIQREKMASLGELTAGIAHEIQNPLNFVKNFAEVSTELADELNQELSNAKPADVRPVAVAIRENLKMITFHSNRADSIIKSMMLHSRSNTGRKVPTDIHTLIDEYLRLSYQGLKARDKNFSVNIHTDFDERIEKVMVIPGDMGRVFLNLFSNAFYSVKEKLEKKGAIFEPMVWVKTEKHATKIEICVRDNGMGISRVLQDKILQPFFTTKPAGQGTGLGLSLSYDVIKTHDGELQIESEEGEFALFKIFLPLAI